MYWIKQTKPYKRSIKKIRTSGNKDFISETEEITRQLSEGGKLGDKHRDHELSGQFKGYRECHIRPDLLLIYQISGKCLILVNMGSHSELFG